MNSSEARLGVTSLKWFLYAIDSTLPGDLSGFGVEVMNSGERSVNEVVQKVRDLPPAQLDLICRMVGMAGREYFGPYSGSELRHFLREVSESDCANNHSSHAC